MGEKLRKITNQYTASLLLVLACGTTLFANDDVPEEVQKAHHLPMELLLEGRQYPAIGRFIPIDHGLALVNPPMSASLAVGTFSGVYGEQPRQLALALLRNNKVEWSTTNIEKLQFEYAPHFASIDAQVTAPGHTLANVFPHFFGAKHLVKKESLEQFPVLTLLSYSSTRAITPLKKKASLQPRDDVNAEPGEKVFALDRTGDIVIGHAATQSFPKHIDDVKQVTLNILQGLTKVPIPSAFGAAIFSFLRPYHFETRVSHGSPVVREDGTLDGLFLAHLSSTPQSSKNSAHPGNSVGLCPTIYNRLATPLRK